MSELKLFVVPDPDEPDGASLFVDGLINDTPYRFLLDTGAARSQVITDDYFASLPTVDTHQSSGVFASSSEELIRVPHMQIGPIPRQEMLLTRRPVDFPGHHLIGMDILKDFRCDFRFDEDRLLLDPPEVDGLDYQPLWMDAVYHPYVDVSFGDHPAATVWDTGASITVADLGVIKANPAHFQPDGEALGTDSTGAQVASPMFMMTDMVIAGHTFTPHRIAGVDFSHVNANLERPFDLILGYNTLRQVNWLFDFPGRRWAVVRR